jgi:hypothetical protein
MTDRDKPIFIFPWKRPSGDPEDSGPKIQINPTAAVTRSQSRAFVSQIIAGAGMMAVLAIIVLGGVNRQSQDLSVGASFNHRQSLQGVVVSADYDRDIFILSYESSVDPDIRDTGAPLWKITLPPGESLSGGRTALQICYQVPDIGKSPEKARRTACSEVVKPGAKLLVEYVILNQETASMIAKTIIGQPTR